MSLGEAHQPLFSCQVVLSNGRTFTSKGMHAKKAFAERDAALEALKVR